MLSPNDRLLRNFPLSLQRALRIAGEASKEDRSAWDWFGGPCQCGLEPGECKTHPRARDAQRPPQGDWGTWMVLAGRGFGKTRTGAEWARKMAFDHPGSRGALVAPTAADIRDTMIEGESGILSVSPPWFMPTYEPSKRKLTWPNGSARRPTRPRSRTVCAVRKIIGLGPMNWRRGLAPKRTRCSCLGYGLATILST